MRSRGVDGRQGAQDDAFTEADIAKLVLRGIAFCLDGAGRIRSGTAPG
jgi:hypothetical protein